MGLIVTGQGVALISGKVGGTVFARNHFGPYMRNFAVPVNPESSRQQAARANLTQIAARWNVTLTEVQRDAWRLYAANVPVINRVGATVFLTGFNHYIRSNTAILIVGGTIIDDAPTLFTLPEADSSFAVTGSEATQLISVTFDDTMAWLDEDASFMSVQQGLPQLNSVNFFGGPWRFMDALEGDAVTPPTTPATMTPAWAISEGQKLWCRARIIRADGRVSNFFRDDTVISA